jgi:ribonuclease HI
MVHANGHVYWAWVGGHSGASQVRMARATVDTVR